MPFLLDINCIIPGAHYPLQSYYTTKYWHMQFIRGAAYEGTNVYKTKYQSRPGPLSNLTAMSRHKMGPILEVGHF